MKIALVALLFLLPASARADAWVCIDSSGNKRFTNVKAEAEGCTPLNWGPAPEKSTAQKPTTIPPYVDRFISVSHGTQRFESAGQYADRYCGQKKLIARHVGTDTPQNAPAISRFECVKKQ